MALGIRLQTSRRVRTVAPLTLLGSQRSLVSALRKFGSQLLELSCLVIRFQGAAHLAIPRAEMDPSVVSGLIQQPVDRAARVRDQLAESSP